MTDDDVREFLHKWWDGVWHKGDIGLIDELFSDRYVQHSPRGTAVLTRRELKVRMVQYLRVLHGAVTSVDAWTVDGDVLWVRATSRGANLETSGASLVTWMASYRFENGQVAEGWVANVPDVDWTRP